MIGLLNCPIKKLFDNNLVSELVKKGVCRCNSYADREFVPVFTEVEDAPVVIAAVVFLFMVVFENGPVLVVMVIDVPLSTDEDVFVLAFVPCLAVLVLDVVLGEVVVVK